MCTADVHPAAVPLLASVLADMRDALAADSGVDPGAVLIGPVDFGTEACT